MVGGHALTYGALARRVAATAAALRQGALTAGPTPRVAILLPPSPAFFEAFLGTGAAGAAAVVLQHGWSDADLAHALAAAHPSAVITDRQRAPQVVRHLPEDTVAVTVGDHVAPALTGTAGAGAPGPPPGGTTPAVADGASAFYVGFTSGSTGRPKGFVRSHHSWRASFAASDVFGIGAGEHVLAPGPLEHSLFLYAAVHALSVGATVHLRERFEAAAVLDALARRPITRVYLVPTMLTSLLRAAERAGRPRFPRVRTVLCSGARWPAASLDRLAALFPHAEAVDFYGASETSFISMRRLVPAGRATSDDGAPGRSGNASAPRHGGNESASGRNGNIGDDTGEGDRGDTGDDGRTGDESAAGSDVGRPFPGVEVAVRRGDGTAAMAGEPGRLWVRSDMLFAGYLDADAEWDAGGWLTVGDLARVDTDGRLHLLGREHGMLVCGGVNVFPEEIEGVLTELPEVAEAAVTGIPHDHWGDMICALVRWHDGRTLPRGDLRAHCRARLDRAKQPQRWLQIADLPRTPAGKIARDVLAQRLHDGTLAATELPA